MSAAIRVTRGRASIAVPALVLLAALATGGRSARGQGPQFDVEGPPGAPESRSRLMPAIGQLGTSAFDVQAFSGPITGRPGPSVSRVPLGQLNPTRLPLPQPIVRFNPPVLEAATFPEYGALEPPSEKEYLGPPDGMTLDQAIEEIIQRNLSLLAVKYEIPMAEADVLTASLRNNPIFYADMQLVPYGHYSNVRPGGPEQADVNVTLQLDIWRKRIARTRSATLARQVTAGQVQDAIRNQVDNLWTDWVDVLAARSNLRNSQRFLQGARLLLTQQEALYEQKQAPSQDVEAARVQFETAKHQLYEAEQKLGATTRALALLLNRPLNDPIELRGGLYDTRPLALKDVPPDRVHEALVQIGLANRPDLVSYRFGLTRTQADLGLQMANRYSDVYLLYQPYTFQQNNYLGLRSAYSYAVGATVALPVFNWNQGNIARARLNVDQTRIEMANLERQVVFEVEEAIREFNVSLQGVLDFRDRIHPAALRVFTAARNALSIGTFNILEFLDAQKDYNDTLRQFYDAVVRHRRAMLDLDTALGVRLIP